MDRLTEKDALAHAILCYNNMLKAPPVVRGLAFDVWWSWCEVLLAFRRENDAKSPLATRIHSGF